MFNRIPKLNLAFLINNWPNNNNSTFSSSFFFSSQIGLCVSMIYGAILTKTNRISRIFHNARRSAKRPTCISPASQLGIVGVIVCIQVSLLIIVIIIFIAYQWEAKKKDCIQSRKNKMLCVCTSIYGIAIQWGREETINYCKNQRKCNFYFPFY